MNCKLCAFENNSMKNECDLLSKKPVDCKMGCYTEAELEKRYSQLKVRTQNEAENNKKEYDKLINRMKRRREDGNNNNNKT